MGAAIQTFSELRNFSGARYLSSAAGVLGGTSNFTATVIIRLLNTTDTAEHIAGNVLNSRGWALFRMPDTATNTTANFRFEVFEGAIAEDLDVAIPMVLGQALVLTVQYTAGAPGVQRIWVNGVPAGARATSSTAAVASLGAFSIGAGVNGSVKPANAMGFLGFAYVNDALSETEIENNVVATLKAQDITTSGISPTWTHVFSTARSCGDGVPTLWENYGTSDTQTLTATGRTGLVLGTPAAVWSGAVTAAGGSVPITAPTDVYLSSAAGNDANDGLTPATAVATFDRVWELLPATQTQPFVVHVDGGASGTLNTYYAYIKPPANVQVGNSAFILIVGDGAGQGTNDGFYEVATGAVAGVSTLTTLTIGAVAANAYKSFTLEMTSGPAAGHRTLIGENSATVIYQLGGFTDEADTPLTPVVGNTYRILRPNACINMVASDVDDVGLSLNNFGQRVHLINIAFSDETYRAVRIFGTKCMIYGVECRGTGMPGITPINARVHFGEAAVIYGADWLLTNTPEVNSEIREINAALGVPAADGARWRGWGHSQLIAGASWNYTCTGHFDDSFMTGYLAAGFVNLVGAKTLLAHGFALMSLAVDESSRFNCDSSFATGRNPGLLRNVLDNRNDAVTLSALLFINSTHVQLPGASGEIALYAGANASFGIQVINGSFHFNGDSFSATGGTLFDVADGAILFNEDGASGLHTATVAGTVYSLGSLRGSTLAITNPSITAFSLVASGAGLVATRASKISVAIAATLTGTVSGGVAIQLSGAGTTLNHTAGVLTIGNASTGAGSSGVQVDSGAQYYGQGAANDAITTAGGSGNRYGMIVTGASQALFTAQPSGVVGATNDFLVDAVAAADGVLAASLSVQNGGGASRIARTT